MHTNMAKINVRKARTRFTQNGEQLAHFRVRNLPRPIPQLSEPKPAEDMRSRLRDDVNRLKRITRGVFAFLRNHHWSALSQAGDLPVDMQHLWFEKCRAITSDNRA